MCFEVITNCQKATKDILVKKRIGMNGSGWLYNLTVDGQTEKWKKGFHYTEPDFPIQTPKKKEIKGNSFHSFSRHAKSDYWKCVCDYTGDKTILGRIPKGSFYYFNKKTEEYCSQEFIYDEDLKSKL